MAATVLNIKIDEVEKKIPDTSSLVTTTVLETKIDEVKIKFLTLLNILQPPNLIN